MALASGYRTYITAALGIAVVVAHQLGFIDDTAEQSLLALLGFASIAALRAAVGRPSTP